ncbi:MAG: hypothetical protein AAF907_10030, partial [Planctomycetota bacterium]
RSAQGEVAQPNPAVIGEGSRNASPDQSSSKQTPTGHGVKIRGRWIPTRSGKEALAALFRGLTELDEAFPERFAARPKHGRKRRYLADAPEKLYPGRPDLADEAAEQVLPGWWMATNNSGATKQKIARLACEVSGLAYGKDVVLVLSK